MSNSLQNYINEQRLPFRVFAELFTKVDLVPFNQRDSHCSLTGEIFHRLVCYDDFGKRSALVCFSNNLAKIIGKTTDDVYSFIQNNADELEIVYTNNDDVFQLVRRTWGRIICVKEHHLFFDTKSRIYNRITQLDSPRFGYRVFAIATKESEFRVSEWLYGVADIDGRVIIPAKYRSIDILQKDVFHVQLRMSTPEWPNNESFSFDIDSLGYPIVHFPSGDRVRSDLDGIGEWNEPFGFAACISHNQFGIIDQLGEFILPPVYSYLRIREGIIQAFNGDSIEWFTLSALSEITKLPDSTKSVIAIDPYLYYKNQNKNDLWGIINGSGQVYLPANYSSLKEIRACGKLFFIAEREGLYGLILDNHEITDFKYQGIQYLSLARKDMDSFLFLLYKDDKIGFYSIQNQALLVDATVFNKEETDINTLGEGLIGLRNHTGNGHRGFFEINSGRLVIALEESWRIQGHFVDGEVIISKGSLKRRVNSYGQIVDEWLDKISPSDDLIDNYGWEDAFDGDPSLYWNID